MSSRCRRMRPSIACACILARASSREKFASEQRPRPHTRPRSKRDLGAAQTSVGIAALWARAKIETVSDELARGADPESVRAKIVEIALQHHLLSQYTALVAIDPQPARPNDRRLISANVPLNLPAGWHYESVFGDETTTQIIKSKLHDQQAALALPQTALGIEGRVLIGLLLLLTAAVLALAFRIPERRTAE
jgi:Ca-activated chloride channel family protein